MTFVIILLFIVYSLWNVKEHYSTFLRGQSIRGDDDVYCTNEPTFFGRPLPCSIPDGFNIHNHIKII